MPHWKLILQYHDGDSITEQRYVWSEEELRKSRLRPITILFHKVHQMYDAIKEKIG